MKTCKGSVADCDSDAEEQVETSDGPNASGKQRDLKASCHVNVECHVAEPCMRPPKLHVAHGCVAEGCYCTCDDISGNTSIKIPLHMNLFSAKKL